MIFYNKVKQTFRTPKSNKVGSETARGLSSNTTGKSSKSLTLVKYASCGKRIPCFVGMHLFSFNRAAISDG
jgi:hypothetical protein